MRRSDDVGDPSGDDGFGAVGCRIPSDTGLPIGIVPDIGTERPRCHP
jgi:hypothetical protein